MKYDELNKRDREIVDRAIAQGNADQGKGKHLDYYTIIKTNKNLVNVILKPTLCNKITPSVHRQECTIHNKPPQVSCIVCNGTEMKPCLLLRQKEEIQKRKDECHQSNSHLSGAAHSLFQKGENEQQQTGCLGCI